MTELIKIQESEGIKTVNARDLWGFLESGQDFSDWIKNRIEKYDFIEGKEFTIILGKTSDLGGRPAKEYHISIEMAKELSMVENNDKGKEARKYFIECEKNAVTTKQLSLEEMTVLVISGQQEKIKQLECTVKEQAPKVEYFEALCESKDAIDIGTVAKILNMGIGRNQLFEILRDQSILMSNNQPYQKYVDMGYFRVIESKYVKPDGSINIGLKTVVFQTGINYIKTLLKDMGY